MDSASPRGGCGLQFDAGLSRHVCGWKCSRCRKSGSGRGGISGGRQSLVEGVRRGRQPGVRRCPAASRSRFAELESVERQLGGAGWRIEDRVTVSLSVSGGLGDLAGPQPSGWTNRPCASDGFQRDTQRKRPLGSGPRSQLLAPLRRSRNALTTVSRPRRARSPAFGASPRVPAVPTDVGAGAGGPVSHHLAGRQADTTHPAGLGDGRPCLGEGQTLVISHDQLPSGTNRQLGSPGACTPS